MTTDDKELSAFAAAGHYHVILGEGRFTWFERVICCLDGLIVTDSYSGVPGKLSRFMLFYRECSRPYA